MINSSVVVPVRIKSLDEIIRLEFHPQYTTGRPPAFSVNLSDNEQFYIKFITNLANVSIGEASIITNQNGKFYKEAIASEKNYNLEKWKEVRKTLNRKWPEIKFRNKLEIVGDIAADLIRYLEFIGPKMYNPDYWKLAFNGETNVDPVGSIGKKDKLFANANCELANEVFSGKEPLVLLSQGVFEDNGTLRDVYEHSGLFSSWKSSPPAEQKPSALILELTKGCDYNACTFCDLYGNSAFGQLNFQQFREHYFKVISAIKNHPVKITKVFLGSGNALRVEQKTLLDVIKFVRTEREDLEKVSVYGRTKTILEKGPKKLEKLKIGGLDMIYLGVESGSDEVLKYINKGCSTAEAISASTMVQQANIQLSTMFMPGVGGIKYFTEHAEKTAEFINKIKPEHVTLIGISPSPTSKYAQQIASEKGNRSLTDEEISQQTKLMLEKVEPYGGHIGMYNSNIHVSARNPVIFDIHYNKFGKSVALEQCDSYTTEENYYARFFQK